MLNVKKLDSKKNLVVGFSGGADSAVLLHYLKTNYPNNKIRAVYIDHGIQEDAKSWGNQCEKFCRSINVNYTLKKVYVNTGSNIEENARDARYKAFSEEVKKDEILVLAHHADDVAETLILRLMRSSGALALSNMDEWSNNYGMEIWRPMINERRANIIDYAKSNKLTWIDDPSNFDSEYDRNFIRNEVLPLLNSRFNDAAGRLSVSAKLLKEDSKLLAPLINNSYNDCIENNILIIDKFKNIDEEHLKSHIIRIWFDKNKVRSFSRKTTEEIVRQLSEYKSGDGITFKSGAREVSAWRGGLHIYDAVKYTKPYNIEWDGVNNIIINGYELSVNKPLNGEVMVMSRRGGEKIKLKGHNFRHSVKKLNAIPPWERDGIPHIYINGNLFCVGEYIKSEEALEFENNGWFLKVKKTDLKTKPLKVIAIKKVSF